MPAQFIPAQPIQPTGSLTANRASFKRNLTSDMNQGPKNARHYSDADIGDGSTDARAAILAADADGPVTLPPGVYAIASNMTLTNRLYLDNGAKLKPASGVTATIPAGYEAGDTQHVFDISAGGSFVIAKMDYITPNHFGAVGDDSTANTTMLQKCANARATSGIPIKVPQGIYQTQKVTFDTASTIRIFGDGTLKAIAPRWVGGIFQFEGCTDIDIDGLTFDTNVANMAAIETGDYNQHYCYALRFIENGATTPCQRITIRNCFFKNLYTRHVDLATAYYLTCQDNYFSSPAQDNQYDCQFLSFTSGSGDNVVKNNSFVVDSVTSSASNASGIIFAGITSGSLLIDGNFFEKCGRNEVGSHRVSPIDLYVDCENVKIINNTVIGTRHAAINMTSCRNIVVSNNYLESDTLDFANWGFVQVSSAGFGSGYGPSYNISVTNNTIVCADATPQAGCWAVGITSTDWQDHMYGVTLSDNQIIGFDVGVYHGGSVYELTIERNKIRAISNGIATIVESGLSGTEASGKHGDVKIRDNDIANLTEGSLTGLGLAVYYSGTFAGTTVGPAIITGNKVKTASAGIATQDIDAVVEDNVLTGCSYGLYLRVADSAKIGGNTFNGTTVQDILLDTITDVIYTKPFLVSSSPEGVVIAAPGAEAINRSGGSDAKKWIKDSGIGSTGWKLFGIATEAASSTNTNLTLTGDGGGTTWADELTYISFRTLSGDFDVSFKLDDVSELAVVGVTTVSAAATTNNYIYFEFSVYYTNPTGVRLFKLGAQTDLVIAGWGDRVVRIVRVGSNLDLYIDDTLIAAANDPAFTTADMRLGCTFPVGTGATVTLYDDLYVAERVGENLDPTLGDIIGENEPEVVAFSTTPKFRFNIAPSRHKSMVLTANVTSSLFLMNEPGMYYMKIVQDSTGGWTFAWDASIVGTPPTLNSGADEATVVPLYFDGTDKFFA